MFEKSDPAWEQAAQELDFDYEPGGWLSEHHLRGFVGTTEGPSVDALKVEVDTFTRRSGEHSRTYTRYRVSFPASLGLGLSLRPEGVLSSVLAFFGAQDIQVGDEAFDAAVTVKGRDDHAIRRFLSPARRMQVLRFLSAHPEARVDDRGVSFARRGRDRSCGNIVGSVQGVVRVARSLCAEQEDDRRLDAALEARDQAEPERALELLQETVRRALPPPPPAAAAATIPRAEGVPGMPPPPPLNEVVLVGQMLHLAGRDDEARRSFEQALEVQPEDPEVRDWLVELGGTLPPPPPPPDDEPGRPGDAAAAEIEVLDDPAPAADLELLDEPAPAADLELLDEPAPAADLELLDEAAASADLELLDEPVADAPPALDVDTVCRALFSSTSSSLDADRRFRESFAGRSVQWSGRVQKADVVPFDFVLGSEPFTRLVAEVHELPQSLYGQKGILAVVRLPREAAEAVQARMGEVVHFQGTLLKVDGLMRNLYLTDGRLLPDPG